MSQKKKILNKCLEKKIDESFLKKNIRLRNTLLSSDIYTYKQLSDKEGEYGFYYIGNIGEISLRKIYYHCLGKFKIWLPNYKKNK
ncbi:MAG: hypothetical protein QW117_02875 [Candidatus Pacearchaeota archaeon]